MDSYEYTERCGKRNGTIIFWKTENIPREVEVIVYSQNQSVDKPIGKFKNLRPNERVKTVLKN